MGLKRNDFSEAHKSAQRRCEMAFPRLPGQQSTCRYGVDVLIQELRQIKPSLEGVNRSTESARNDCRQAYENDPEKEEACFTGANWAVFHVKKNAGKSGGMLTLEGMGQTGADVDRTVDALHTAVTRCRKRYGQDPVKRDHCIAGVKLVDYELVRRGLIPKP
jgi:hypothetical protein